MSRIEVLPLTGLRFFAAFFVLISHSLPKIFPWPKGQEVETIYSLVGSLAGIGMMLFFVLSGFVIHYNYSDQLATPGWRGPVNFLVARFARLYPLFITCVLIELGIMWGYSQTPVNIALAAPFYLTMTQSWFYMMFPNGNSLIYQGSVMSAVAWSISTEFGFYILYIFFRPAIARLSGIRSIVLAGIGVSAVAIAIIHFSLRHAAVIDAQAIAFFGAGAARVHWQDSFLRWFLYFSPYVRVFEFALGCLAAAAFMKLSSKAPSKIEMNIGNLVLALAVASLVILHIQLFGPYPSPLKFLNIAFGFAPSIAIVLFCLARYESGLGRLLSTKYILIAAGASYSIYLLHLPFIMAFRWEAAPLFSFRVVIADSLRFSLMTAGIIGASLITLTLIEMPARKVLRKWLSVPVDAGLNRERKQDGEN